MSDISATVVSNNQEGASQADPVGSFSFSGAHEKAMSMLGDDSQPTEPVVEQTPSPTEPQSQQATPSPDAKNIDGASAKQLAQLKDDDLVEVPVDGEMVQMSWKDAKGGVMRQAKFTKEMQNLRRDQQAFDADRQTLTQARNEREALVSLLKDEQLLTAFLQRQYPHLLQQAQAQAQAAAGQQPNGQVNADDIASIGQVDQIARGYAQNVANLVNELREGLKAELSNVTQHIEDRQATVKLSSEINTTIKGLFSEHPYLEKVIPQAEQLLRYEVYQLQPSTPEETVEAFKQVFSGWVDSYKQQVAESNKTTAINKQKLVANNIQPPGGAGVQPQPTDYKTKDGKIDWNKLREMALSQM